VLRRPDDHRRAVRRLAREREVRQLMTRRRRSPHGPICRRPSGGVGELRLTPLLYSSGSSLLSPSARVTSSAGTPVGILADKISRQPQPTGRDRAPSQRTIPIALVSCPRFSTTRFLHGFRKKICAVLAASRHLRNLNLVRRIGNGSVEPYSGNRRSGSPPRSRDGTERRECLITLRRLLDCFRN
jgi:hypothetical protein